MVYSVDYGRPLFCTMQILNWRLDFDVVRKLRHFKNTAVRFAPGKS
ncbi:hypothetical protein [Falsochrobactrum shanghaiense]|nr:hypothetical protein [Falsochrobactrum shanghaiense]